MSELEDELDESLVPLWTGEVRPGLIVKRELTKIIAEKWAREIILERMGLRSHKGKETEHESTQFVVYDLHEAPKHRQTKSVNGVRLSTVESSFQGFVRDLLAREIRQAEAFRPRHQAARKRLKALERMSEAELQAELAQLIVDQHRDKDVAADDSVTYARRPVRTDLIPAVCERLGPDQVRRVILAHDFAYGGARRDGLSWAFRVDDDEEDPIADVVRSLTERLVSDMDGFLPELLDGLILDGSAKVMAELFAVVQDARPDFVVLEGSKVGQQVIWRHAHVFEIKGNNRHLTGRQLEAIGKTKLCKHVDYTVLYFDLDYEIRPAQLRIESARKRPRIDWSKGT